MWQLVVRLTGAKVSHKGACNFKLQDINLLSKCRQQGSSKRRNSFTNLHGDKSNKTVDLIFEVLPTNAAEWKHILWKDIYRSKNDVVWVWNLVINIAGGKESEGVWEHGVEENIWIEEGRGNGRMEEIA